MKTVHTISTCHYPNLVSITLVMALWHFLLLLSFLLFLGADARVITLENKCNATIWPGLKSLANGQQDGLQLDIGKSINLTAPEYWMGIIWGRDGCKFDAFGEGGCLTATCGSIRCQGPVIMEPFTIAALFLNGTGLDYYSVDLTAGFNLPISILPYGGGGSCNAASCYPADMTQVCPSDLQVRTANGELVACKRACDNNNNNNNSNGCLVTDNSRLFKAACPTALTYSNDPSGLLACPAGANYLISFC